MAFGKLWFAIWKQSVNNNFDYTVQLLFVRCAGAWKMSALRKVSCFTERYYFGSLYESSEKLTRLSSIKLENLESIALVC